jgi:glycosyltransferase involved in cell wall biosynthesis
MTGQSMGDDAAPGDRGGGASGVRRSGPAAPKLSIVVPALDEQDNVEPLVAEIDLGVRQAGVEAELILVDDGSSDGTLERGRALTRVHDWVRVLHRPRPQGQSAAMHAGIAAARGELIGMLDADLQNDPADLLIMVRKLEDEGVDFVQGDRSRNRRDSAVRRLSSVVGRLTRRLLLGDPVRDTGCSARVMRREFAAALPLQYKGMHRFIPVYASLLGARIAEMPVGHRSRRSGQTKYGLGVVKRGRDGLFDCFTVRWMRSRLRDVSATEAEADATEPAAATGAIVTEAAAKA